MKSSEILRRAAQRIESGKSAYACEAICREVMGRSYRVTATPENFPCWRYFKMFEPWYRPIFWWPREKKHGPRIIGLCLAAAIAESEGD